MATKTTTEMPAAEAAALRRQSGAHPATDPPPSPPRPRGSLHNATTSPSLDVPGAADARAWADRVRGLSPAEQTAAIIDQIADGMTAQAQHGHRLTGLDERLAHLREHFDARLDAADAKLARMGQDVAGVRHELTGARAVLGAAADRGAEAVTRSKRAEVKASEAAAVAEMAAVAASERSGLDLDLDIPAVLRDSMADPRETLNTGPAVSRPPSQGRRRHETPPAGSAPAPSAVLHGHALATVDDLELVRDDVREIKQMLRTAALDATTKGKDIAWTKQRVALLAGVLLVAGYFGRLTYEWATRPASTPAAIARPAASGGH